MLDLLGGFIQELRAAGLPVSLTENLDAMEAVKHIPIEDRDAFKYALAATLVKNNAHWRAFETVFEVYFSLRGPEYAVDGEGDGDQWGEMQPGKQQQGGPGGAMEQLTPEQLAEMLYRASAQRRRGDDASARPSSRQPLRGDGAGSPGRRHVLPLPHAAEPRSRRHAREADGVRSPRGRRRHDRPRGAART